MACEKDQSAHSPLLPRWRDLQPLLLRSAGVVGLVATIMAVVSSDALHLGAEEPAALAAVEPVAPPVVVPSAELNAALEAATPEPVATAATASPPEPVTMESTSAPAPVALASAIEAAKPAPEPAPPAPIAVATVAITPEPASEPAAELQPDIADFALTAPAPSDGPELVPEPVNVAAAEAPSLEEPVSPEPAANPSATAAVEQPTSAAPIEPAAPVLAAELRSDETTPASPTSEVAATASAPAAREAMASLSPDTDDLPAAEISIAALRQSDAPAAATDPDRLAWPDGAATCPRDWVEPEEGSRAEDISADCMATAALFTPVAEDEQAALEERRGGRGDGARVAAAHSPAAARAARRFRAVNSAQNGSREQPKLQLAGRASARLPGPARQVALRRPKSRHEGVVLPLGGKFAFSDCW